SATRSSAAAGLAEVAHDPPVELEGGEALAPHRLLDEREARAVARVSAGERGARLRIAELAEDEVVHVPDLLGAVAGGHPWGEVERGGRRGERAGGVAGLDEREGEPRPRPRLLDGPRGRGERGRRLRLALGAGEIAGCAPAEEGEGEVGPGGG